MQFHKFIAVEAEKLSLIGLNNKGWKLHYFLLYARV